MDVKFGKIKPSNNFFLESSTQNSDENFFVTKSQQKPEQPPIRTNETLSRINDYDSNILENNAYLVLSDEVLKYEHKINLLEITLLKINNEIDALNSLGYSNQIAELEERKRKIENELKELNKKYQELDLGTRLSGQITSAIDFTSNKKFSSIQNLKKFVSKNILSKISKKFDYSQSMKEALEKLSNINLSVDELIKMQVPYGETLERYEKLTAYLNKANVIHSQISKNINSTKKKEA